MEKDQIRLECLKLWHRHDRHPADTVKVAKEYEAYILGAQEEKSAETSPALKAPDKFKRKAVGNSDILS